jgi:hypothetical protein
LSKGDISARRDRIELQKRGGKAAHAGLVRDSYELPASGHVPTVSDDLWRVLYTHDGRIVRRRAGFQ